MSFLPLILPNPYNSARLLNQQFGFSLQEEEDYFAPFTSPAEWRAMMQRSGNYRHSATDVDDESSINMDKDKFQVNLDVQQFKPEEISVKITGKSEITVEGKHDELQDEHGFISRHFVRKYIVPQECNIEEVISQLSSDGVLSITAPKDKSPDSINKEITITQTGKPAIDILEKKI
ncbi:PREDICTED: protein lethal(2)essential for life-like [Nicrophorus vespilloides]|uniref:Protein lethal(2)essential for life-like n=1 Tax=Nicrophorus vespilloides TaxID=110193 RepID=A0ABM1NBZ3_NICVS|nr:PREDICTED: protein lethal(2)essential for life-like [Nicrophorus vespilloides]